MVELLILAELLAELATPALVELEAIVAAELEFAELAVLDAFEAAELEFTGIADEELAAELVGLAAVELELTGIAEDLLAALDEFVELDAEAVELIFTALVEFVEAALEFELTGLATGVGFEFADALAVAVAVLPPLLGGVVVDELTGVTAVA